MSDIDIPALQNGGTEFGGSRESFEEEYPEYRDYDSTTTPSDASTVIFRELLSSRCSSNLPVTGEECLVGGSYDNSPISSRHIVATAGEERTENSSEERTENSSPQIQRYSVDIARSDSKTTPVGFEGCGAVSPESDDKDIHSNTHENTKESLEVGDSVIPEVSDDPEGEENELTLNSIVSNLSSSTLNSNGTDFPDSTEQVTDIYASKLNHAPSPAEGTTVSEDSNLCGTGVSFDQSLERNKKMESYLHYQRSGGPVVDSEPIGMNGVRTHGYASNDGKTANNTTGSGTTSTTTPAVDVPHHSLTLALSDPESPSSYQVDFKFSLSPLPPSVSSPLSFSPLPSLYRFPFLLSPSIPSLLIVFLLSPFLSLPLPSLFSPPLLPPLSSRDCYYISFSLPRFPVTPAVAIKTLTPLPWHR